MREGKWMCRSWTGSVPGSGGLAGGIEGSGLFGASCSRSWLTRKRSWPQRALGSAEVLGSWSSGSKNHFRKFVCMGRRVRIEAACFSFLREHGSWSWMVWLRCRNGAVCSRDIKPGGPARSEAERRRSRMQLIVLRNACQGLERWVAWPVSQQRCQWVSLRCLGQ